MTRVAVQCGQRLQIAGACEFVKVDNRLIVASDPVYDEVAADEFGTANYHYQFPPSLQASQISKCANCVPAHVF